MWEGWGGVKARDVQNYCVVRKGIYVNIYLGWNGVDGVGRGGSMD